jgi:IclR family mhp operon transcriptional activator
MSQTRALCGAIPKSNAYRHRGRVLAAASRIALAIPGGGPVLGSLNLIFFSSSMTPEIAAKKYLSSMKVAVKEIERPWSAANKARGKVA